MYAVKQSNFVVLFVLGFLPAPRSCIVLRAIMADLSFNLL